MSETSERLLRIIRDKGISYGELSQITGIPKSALQRYATGETKKIPLDRVETIASALGVNATEILGWDDSSVSDIVQHIDEMNSSIQAAQKVACILAGTLEFDSAVLTHPDVVRALDIAQTATKEHLMDAVDYLEFQIKKHK